MLRWVLFISFIGYDLSQKQNKKQKTDQKAYISKYKETEEEKKTMF